MPEREADDWGLLIRRWSAYGAAIRATVEDFSIDIDELPFVAIGVEEELDDSELARDADVADGEDLLYAVEACSARPDDEGADAKLLVWFAEGVDTGDALVVVVVATDDDIGAMIVERFPEVVEPMGIASWSRVEDRVMPDSHGAVFVVGCQVVAEPGELLGGRTATDVATVGVKHDDVPVAVVEGVPTFARLTSDAIEENPEVLEGVAVVVVVAGYYAKVGHKLTPVRLEAVLVLVERAVLVGGVTSEEV